MMKKQEKLPEVAAFEQAFGSSARRASAPLSQSQWLPTPSASAVRAMGRPSGSSPKLRAPGSPAAAWKSSPGQPLRRGTGSNRAQRWDDEDDLEEDEWEARASRKRPAAPNDQPGRASQVLVRLVLIGVALLAAYSLQSHSRRQYIPGTVSGATVSNISYTAGWPLAYAHINAQQVPLSSVTPTPAFHFINPVLLIIDVLLLAVPFWLILEAVWLLWVFILERFGPQRLGPRLVAIGFTALPATLWMVGALVAGIFVGFNGGQMPFYLLPVLLPAIPGFGLAAATSVVLGVPPVLWPLDFGVFLLALALPLAVLTICLYALFCFIGRKARGMSQGYEE
jgi:hypothetical protein